MPVQTLTTILTPDLKKSYMFDFEDFIKTELGLDLNKEFKKEDDHVCKFYLRGGCNKGASCQFQHHNGGRDKAVVCKHWLRSLCKKGDQCEFLHEFNLKKMPECWFYNKYRECTNGDECMYLHVDPDTEVKECLWYARGFCKDGPSCQNKHVRRLVCQNYLTGHCPLGPNCPNGHPKYELPQSLNKDEGDLLEVKSSMPITRPAVGGFGDGHGFKRLDDVICYRCGLKGHYANQCSSGRGSMRMQ